MEKGNGYKLESERVNREKGKGQHLKAKQK